VLNSTVYKDDVITNMTMEGCYYHYGKTPTRVERIIMAFLRFRSPHSVQQPGSKSWLGVFFNSLSVSVHCQYQCSRIGLRLFSVCGTLVGYEHTVAAQLDNPSTAGQFRGRDRVGTFAEYHLPRRLTIKYTYMLFHLNKVHLNR